MIDVLHAARPTDPGEPVLVAGEPEARSRDERSRTGIPVPAPLADRIRAICERAGAPFLLHPG